MAVEKDGVFSGPMTGAQRAFLNLAYNLYLIEHHSDSKKAQSIRDSFVVRLKSSRTDDFIGKLFEAYASAAFLKAGFQLDYENEHDGRKSHVEFVATYPATGKKFAVEVKARNRLIGADGPMDEAKRLRVSQKLTTALRKSSEHARIVFIEVNIPDVVGHDYAGTWVHAALDQIKDAESFIDGKGELYPPAYVVVTNHAYHNNLEAVDVGLQAIADGYRIPNFGPRSQINRFKDYLENLEQHKEILALFASLKAHSHIPVTFDGEIPEFAFGKDEEYPRLRIGHTYLVPNGKGEQILGVLEKAIVVESWKKAQGIYRLENGQRVLVAHELTERELSAWKRHPKTFFGQYEEEHDPPTNWLEMAEFLYRSYSHTSKERLLEFMAAHEDIQSMAALSQEELAVIYCESMAWSIWNDAHKEPVDDQK